MIVKRSDTVKMVATCTQISAGFIGFTQVIQHSIKHGDSENVKMEL